MFALWGLIKDFLLLGILAAGLVALSFSSSLSNTYTVQPQGVVATTSLSSHVPEVQKQATTTVAVATTTPKIAPKAVPKPVAKPEVTPKPKVEDMGLTLDDAITAVNSLAQGQTPTGQSVNDRVRAALVNILCTTDRSGSESISGSGVIIDPRGVILTNAHVAQFFLLKNYPDPNTVSCIVRTGSPAYPRYTADLMFLPPSWVHDNAYKITQDAPTGTGERDYALLRITGGVSSSITLPSQFPFLLTAVNAPDVGADVLQAGYAAGFLGGITIQSDLYASSAWTKIRDVFTFNANTIDLLSLGGSIVAQGGSSGGPVVNQNGVLVGIIVTSSGTGDTSTRDLHALATAYIVRDFELERGKSIQQELSSDLAQEVTIFNKVYFENLKAQLVAELEK